MVPGVDFPGMRLFRDYIWGSLRPIFQADHRFYRKHGLHDYPHRDPGQRLRNMFLPGFLRIPSVKRKVKAAMPGIMTKKLKEVVG